MIRLKRRRLIQGAALGALTTGLAMGRAVATASTDLVAAQGEAQLAPDGYPATPIWGYDAGVPGPVIRLRQGESVRRRFINRLPEASTVHWHGIRLANAMDGVPYLTQGAVEPGGEFAYDFIAPDAGTYWYHPHSRSYEQVARGLYGALIVDEADGAPEVDVDEVLMIGDWRLAEDATIMGGFENMHDWAHGGRIGNWITVNGKGGWNRAARRHERFRLRLINSATARIFSLEAMGLEGWVMALDGMPLDEPRKLGEITLAPAQRVDLIVDVTAEEGEEAHLVSYERDGGYAIATFRIDGTLRAGRLPEPDRLPPNSVPAVAGLDDARSADLVMEGGAMGRMRGAMMNGRMMEMRDLVEAGKVWAFNGMADMQEAPFIEAGRGETVRIAMRNDTAWPHAMHLHGHHFRQVLADKSLGPLRDTLLVDRGQTAEIAFVADNPGDWLLHCHMLEHSAGGMMTWLRVG